MDFDTGVKWAKRLGVVFTFTALGLAGGSLRTAFNPSFGEYMEQAVENDPTLLETRGQHPYHQDWYIMQAATDLRTNDNLRQVGTGFAGGLGAGLLAVGIGAAAGAMRRKPS